MAKRYGVPYQGSKNAIAKDILSVLPAAPVLVDLFAGGCAITHAALEECESLCPKWEKVISNDINPMPGELFRRAANGEYAQETRWISREDFFLLKDTDPYVRYCWSFGNNGRDYLYSKEAEPWKRALHHAYIHGSTALLEVMAGALPDDVRRGGAAAVREYIRKNEALVRERYISWYRSSSIMQLDRPFSSRLAYMESLQGLQRLQSLQGLQRTEQTYVDYHEKTIPDGAVVYCDIPYENTQCECYDQTFDHAEFRDWACQTAKRAKVYVSSYHIDDPRFECVWEKEKPCLLSSGGSNKRTERLYKAKASA